MNTPTHPYTVLGSSGFIGSHVTHYLQQQSLQVYCPQRHETLQGKSLGHVFYCIGLTADFRQRPWDTVQAHVTCLAELLQHATYQSWTYLSSTRIYHHSQYAQENQPLQVNPNRADELYNISKLMGESLCLALPNPAVRVVRLSNVFGHQELSHNFLDSLVTQALVRQPIVLQTALQSSKDYIYIEDVIPLLYQIALRGQQRLYNLASGQNITHQHVLEQLQRATGCSYTLQQHAPLVEFPTIDISRITQEFNFRPTAFSQALTTWLNGLKQTKVKVA